MAKFKVGDRVIVLKNDLGCPSGKAVVTEVIDDGEFKVIQRYQFDSGYIAHEEYIELAEKTQEQPIKAEVAPAPPAGKVDAERVTTEGPNTVWNERNILIWLRSQRVQLDKGNEVIIFPNSSIHEWIKTQPFIRPEDTAAMYRAGVSSVAGAPVGAEKLKEALEKFLHRNEEYVAFYEGEHHPDHPAIEEYNKALADLRKAFQGGVE